MRRLRWPSKRRLICPWRHHEVLAIPIEYGLPAPGYEEQIEQAVREGKIVHHGCFMMPWRWWRPECKFPIPSDDGYWDNVTENQRNKMLDELKRAWAEESRRRRMRDEAQETDLNPPFVELHAHSNFSFLEGASHIEELALRVRVRRIDDAWQ